LKLGLRVTGASLNVPARVGLPCHGSCVAVGVNIAKNGAGRAAAVRTQLFSRFPSTSTW
jgi:hypothetical protein